MMNMTLNQKITTLHNLHSILDEGSTDGSRRNLKKLFRDVITHTFDDNARQLFHTATDITINRVTDMVAREVLINLTIHAIGLPPTPPSTHGLPIFDFGLACTNLVSGWNDPNLCHDQHRGGGKSKGFHSSMWASDACATVFNDLYTMWQAPGVYDLTEVDPAVGIQAAYGTQAIETKTHSCKLFTAVEPIPLDPNLKKAVDALLNQASQGAITNADYYTDHIKSLNGQVIDALVALDEAKAKGSTPAAPVAVEVDGATLTYEVVMRNAKDLFTDANGNKSGKLDFMVETLVWKDANGVEVRHPQCPEIDTSYKFRMHHIIKYLTAKKFRQHTWSHGHTGTGKTTFIEQVEARLGFPIERLNLDSNLERSDIVGNVDIKVKDGAPYSFFTEGLLPKAMVQPMTFLLDEVDAGRPDMLFVLQRALENKGLTLTEDGGRVVKPHPLFTFAGTANSRGQGDEFGWYQGVRPMNLAFLNRFGAFIEVNYMDEDDELAFITDAYPNLNRTMAEQFCRFTQLVRASFMNGEISQTISPRNLHAMAQYYQHYTDFMSHDDAVKEVIETCVSDAAPADNQQRITELASRVFAGGL